MCVCVRMCVRLRDGKRSFSPVSPTQAFFKATWKPSPATFLIYTHTPQVASPRNGLVLLMATDAHPTPNVTTTTGEAVRSQKHFLLLPDFPSPCGGLYGSWVHVTNMSSSARWQSLLLADLIKSFSTLPAHSKCSVNNSRAARDDELTKASPGVSGSGNAKMIKTLSFFAFHL